MPGIKVGGESWLQIHRTGGSVSGPDPFFDCEGEYQGEGEGPRNSARDLGGGSSGVVRWIGGWGLAWRGWASTLAVCCLAVGPGAGWGEVWWEVFMQSDEEQIRGVVATWLSATAAGDAETILSLMTEDVVFLLPGRGPMRREEFASLARASAGAALPKFESVSDIHEVEVSGDLAYLWNRLALAITPPGADRPIERSGYTLSIFRRVNGKWLLSRDANLVTTLR